MRFEVVTGKQRKGDSGYVNPRDQVTCGLCSTSTEQGLIGSYRRRPGLFDNVEAKNLYSVSNSCGSYSDLGADISSTDHELDEDTASKSVCGLLEEEGDGKMVHRCLTVILTLLHLLASVCAAFCCIFSTFSWTYGAHCLPRLVDHFGDPIEFVNGFPLICESIVYCFGFMCVLNILMALGLHCWKSSFGGMVLNLTFVALLVAFSVLSGSTFTVHYLLWCDSIAQKMPSNKMGCDQAALRFDLIHKTSNMTAFRSQMEIQQASAWALFPLTFITVIVYALSIRALSIEERAQISPCAAGPPNHTQRNTHYLYTTEQDREDRTPLFPEDVRAPSVGKLNYGSDVGDDRRVQDQPVPPYNPFDS